MKSRVFPKVFDDLEVAIAISRSKTMVFSRYFEDFEVAICDPKNQKQVILENHLLVT